VGNGDGVDILETAGGARDRFVQHRNHGLYVSARASSGTTPPYSAWSSTSETKRRWTECGAVLDEGDGGLVARGLDA
jgi:hypothetical protein